MGQGSALSAEEIDTITNGVSSNGMDVDCSCEGLANILRQQGLTLEDFMAAAEQAPVELYDFVQMKNTPRS